MRATTRARPMTQEASELIDAGRRLRRTIRKGACLILEDDPDTVGMLCRLLNFHGEAVETFDNPEMMLLRVQSDPSDIKCAIIDVHLGNGIAGEDVARAVDARYPQIVTVVHTADDEAARRISQDCERITVIRKGGDFCELLKSLGMRERPGV